MNNKLYVGNLSFQCQESQLENLFQDCGEVKSVKIITDRESGKSRGFGFVEMSSEEEAQSAVDKMNGQEVDGRSLKVSIAHDKEKTGGGGFGGGGRRGGFGGGGRRGGFGGGRGRDNRDR